MDSSASLAVEPHRSRSARQQETHPPPRRARPLSLEARVLLPPPNPAACSPPQLQPASRARLAASLVADRRLPRREALVACLEMLRLLPQPAVKPARAHSEAAPVVRRVVRVSLGTLPVRRLPRRQGASSAAAQRLPAVRVVRKLALPLPRRRAPLPLHCLEERPRHLRLRRLPPSPRSGV